MSRLTYRYAVYTCVLQFHSSNQQKLLCNTQVIPDMLHTSESYIVYYMQVITCVLHTSQCRIGAHESQIVSTLFACILEASLHVAILVRNCSVSMRSHDGGTDLGLLMLPFCCKINTSTFASFAYKICMQCCNIPLSR